MLLKKKMACDHQAFRVAASGLGDSVTLSSSREDTSPPFFWSLKSPFLQRRLNFFVPGRSLWPPLVTVV